MTGAERAAVAVIVQVAQAGEWPKGICPRCQYSQARGHKCSCPVKRAYKLLGRVVGQPEAGLEDDDLIVERAMAQLNTAFHAEHRSIVWEAVEAAMQLGART